MPSGLSFDVRTCVQAARLCRDAVEHWQDGGDIRALIAVDQIGSQWISHGCANEVERKCLLEAWKPLNELLLKEMEKRK